MSKIHVSLPPKGVSLRSRDFSKLQDTVVPEVNSSRPSQDVLLELMSLEKAPKTSTQVIFLIPGKAPILKRLSLSNALQFPVLVKARIQKPHQTCNRKASFCMSILI